MKKQIVLLTLLLMCTSAYAGRLKIVTSIIPLCDITAAIAGDKAEVQAMVPPGTSPHVFSPKPSQLKAMADADMFIQVGSGMEFWAGKMIMASGNKKFDIVTITDGMKLFAGDSDEPVDKSGRRTGNPHVWLDPVLVKEFSGRICVEMAKLDPADAAYFRANYFKFSAGLDKLDSYFRVETKKFRVKELVSFHPAWTYFEARYGLKEIAVIEAVPGKEPSPKELQNIIEEVKKYSIKTIFAETYLSRKAADVIAKEAGVNVLILNPEGGEGEDYITFMKKNFDVIKEAME